MRRIATLVLAAVLAISPRCVDAQAQPTFDVASIKANQSGAPRGGTIEAGRLLQTGVTLRQLIELAYGTRDIAGGPSWVDSDTFDVEAKGTFGLEAYLPRPDGSAPPVALMLQRLLSERFTLSVHRENREIPVYALVAAKQLGPRLSRSSVDCAAALATAVNGGPAVPDRHAQGPPKRPPCSVGGGRGHIIADSIDMVRFAAVLAQSLDRSVVDRTGLKGAYNVDVEWAPDLPLSADAPTAPTSGLPMLVTALQEQLGLRLESTRAPVDVLVIDHVEAPTPN